MAQALFERAAQGRHEAPLGGKRRPAERVHPEVVEVMRELGIDLADRKYRGKLDVTSSPSRPTSS